MRRRVGEGAPEARVKRRIRTRLKELGFDEADWEEEARIDFFPGSGGSADFLLTTSKMCVMIMRKQKPKRHHKPLLAEISSKAKLSVELNKIEQIYKERMKRLG